MLAPLAVLVRFYGFFGRAWAPYFVNVPIICMFVFEMLVFFAPESEGSWLCFLFMPLYYAAAPEGKAESQIAGSAKAQKSAKRIKLQK